MKTKNIFKTLVLAAVLVSACSKNDIADDFKGYTLPVTINVTRQGDEPATRATYNESTKKLSFSAGDKLFVRAASSSAGQFAGLLDYDSETGNFSGDFLTQSAYSGTVEGLLTSASDLEAFLMPAGYGGYGFLGIADEGSYYADLSLHPDKAFALTKAAAVEQFSYERSYEYDNGFALSPGSAVLNFTITGLAANADVTVSLNRYESDFISKSVATNASGVATFAIGILNSFNSLGDYTLTVGGNAIALPVQDVAAGHIYNISRSALPPAEGHALSASVVGEIVGSDGNAYAAVDKGNLPTGVTAVAMVAYKSGSNGLAIALTDETGTMNWTTANSTCGGKTAVGGKSWHLPSQDEWKQMFASNGLDEESFTGLNSAITTAGGTGITKWQNYWTSSLDGSDPIYIMIQSSSVSYDNPDTGEFPYNVRACLAF